jgi:oligosaccharide amylase
MPRDIPVGNGSLLVNFDRRYQLRDIYWPYVGQENHTTGHICRFGVWVDGQFSWIADDAWTRTQSYQEDTLVTEVTLYNPTLSLRLVCHDAVDFHEDLYLREVRVDNQDEQDREVRLFFTHDFHIGGNDVGDSAYYEPERRAVFHYKANRWFMINTAKVAEGDTVLGVDQWAVGKAEVNGQEGTWRDAEDGRLSGNAVVQGAVDSTVALHLMVPGRGQSRGWYWIAAAEDFVNVIRMNRSVRQKGPATFLDRTRNYWRLWISKEDRGVCNLPHLTANLYRRSLLILRTQIDDRGAIIAATDFDIAHYGRDTYCYMWARDGALVAAALVDAGYSQVTRRFFTFCHQIITDEGYLLHKHNPDGSLASSWHGWYVDGTKQLPIQEDETALVLWALWRHFDRFRDVEFIKPHYRGLIIRAANWLVDYRDPQTKLPQPSWDLWEERRGIHAWTVGAVWGGLNAAARFADAFGEQDLASKYTDAAQEIRSAAAHHLWRPELNRFARTINPGTNGQWEVDPTVDASLMGLWYFGHHMAAGGLFAADDSRIVSTMQTIDEQLRVDTEVKGIARYQNDYYHQVSHDLDRVPGNPWFICTLWLAQWLIATAESQDDLKAARELIEWASVHALPSGVMAEQVHPYDNEPLSVSPLTWSHATLVAAVQEYTERWHALASTDR